MSAVRQLGYLVFTVSDLSRWEQFGTEILGMAVVNRRAGEGFALRMDDHAQRIILEPGPADDLACAGWEVEDAGALAAVAACLRDAGVTVVEGTPEQAAARCVKGLVRCTDPDGLAVEIHHGPTTMVAPFVSPVLKSPYLTGVQGMGHIALCVKDKEKAHAFYHALLGMPVSDHIVQELAPGMTADATFLHCNPRHHSLAFIALPSPKRMHHFMVQLTDMDDLGFRHDACIERQVALEMTLGRHPNDEMLSFYARTPSGFSVEIGWGGLTIDDTAAWRVKHFDRLSSWGHKHAAA